MISPPVRYRSVSSSMTMSPSNRPERVKTMEIIEPDNTMLGLKPVQFTLKRNAMKLIQSVLWRK